MFGLKRIFNPDAELLIKSSDAFPKDIKKCCLQPDFKKLIFCSDVYTPWKKGKKWLYQETVKYQPKTAGILLSASDFFITARKKDIGNIRGFNLDLYQEVNNKEILIYRQMHGQNPSDDGYKDWITRINDRLTKRDGKPTQLEERYLSLPESIQKAYYYRFDGFQFPSNHSSPSIAMGILPASTSSWYSLNRYLAPLRLKKKYLPWFEERFSGIKPEKKDAPYINFMCFLDTRTDDPKKGDVFFVKNHIQDGIIYHIKDTDIENMRVLSEPAIAIDLYCEHILQGNKIRFDFLPYTSAFDA